ncbi:MAG: UDP-3-O-(3-hydroxymyristoyl)glucosamine N-acyltransferase [Acidobacteria bacterium]|nr:UDP-3-O-(3-hydroxymyristoyl)glucosamine N-acyltransferase [Acidobacteriota bacterium]
MKTQEIAEFLNGRLTGGGDIEIVRAASLDTAGPDAIGFLEKPENFAGHRAGALIVPENFDAPETVPTIAVGNPKLAFAKLAAVLHPFKWREGRHPSAVIDETAEVRADFVGAFVSVGADSQIGEGTNIFDGVRIGDNVRIGKCTIIHPNVVIYDGVTIGSDCIIHAGAVIGADGFGFVRDGAAGYVRFPQIGTVTIGDGVEIGAGTCIDRGALGETRIGSGTKIDNLVQIAHNVQIGARVVIAAQTGISGSTVLEDDCVIGGQVGFGDHATVKSGAIIGSQAGVLPGKIVRPGVWWGTPVQPLDEYKRQNAHLKGLGRLRDEIRELKRQLKEKSD